jgi:hypothetical protein
VKRCQKLWKAGISSPDDLELLLVEVDTLNNAFEGCLNDLEDLQLMKRALRIYQQDYLQLGNERLSWSEFEALARNCSSEAQSALGDDEIPWPPDDVIAAFVDAITSRRQAASATWISVIQREAEGINAMSARGANRLYARASNPPPVLTEPDGQRLSSIVKAIETRLEDLKIEWLLEKFRELSSPMRMRFLQIVSEAEGGGVR